LPKIQAGYDKPLFSLDFVTEDFEEISFLYKLYIHSIVTKKAFLMEKFMEERFFQRFSEFLEVLGNLDVPMDLSENIDFKSCRLERLASGVEIRDQINEIYSGIDVEPEFR